jgi:hypothetical protein
MMIAITPSLNASSRPLPMRKYPPITSMLTRHARLG